MAKIKKKNRINPQKLDRNTIAFLKSIADFGLEHEKAREVCDISNNRYRNLREQGFMEKKMKKGVKRMMITEKGRKVLKHYNINYAYRIAGIRHDQVLCDNIFNEFIITSDDPVGKILEYQNASEIQANFGSQVRDLKKNSVNISLPDGGFYNGRSYEFVEQISQNYSQLEIESKHQFAEIFNEFGVSHIYHM